MRGSQWPGPWVSGCYGETLQHILLGDVHGASAAGRWYPAIEFAPGHNLNASLGEQNRTVESLGNHRMQESALGMQESALGMQRLIL